MTVKPDDLDNPERGTRLTNREPGETKPRLSPASGELAAMRERIVAAKKIRPEGAELCRDCWERGRDAALRLVEGKAAP